EVCDVIASPTMPGLPLHRGVNESDPMAMYLSDIYTVSLNLAGLPGISLPCGTVESFPIGMQWIGKPYKEAELLSLAAASERACK
ncbi:MAG: amidase family protein, partial [Fibrobacteraceae bacterium]